VLFVFRRVPGWTCPRWLYML